MTKHRGRAVGLHEERVLARARDAFMYAPPEVRGSIAKRIADINVLPVVQWRGRVLRAIRCHGDFGKGPHDVNVPESLLWALLDLRAFKCPYHR